MVVWDPEGKIVDVCVNLPGNFHDSKSILWCHVYDHFAALPDGHIVVCDSAFTCSGDMEGKLYKLKDKKDKDGEWENSEPTELDAMLTHIRQCAEWGNNVLTGCFRRLKQRLPTDNVKKARIQWCCILLHNWRTKTCDRNQIKTYFANLADTE